MKNWLISKVAITKDYGKNKVNNKLKCSVTCKSKKKLKMKTNAIKRRLILDRKEVAGDVVE